jgi:hypothetical protein
MALTSTGSISAFDIKREFNASAANSNISLTSYYSGGSLVVSGVGSIPSSGAVSFNQYRGTDLRFIRSFTDDNTSGTFIKHFAVSESTGNIYAIIAKNWFVGTSEPTWSICKFSADGIIQWKRQWFPAGAGNPVVDNLLSIGLDASDNVYVKGYFGVNGTQTKNGVSLIGKWNSSGVLQWQVQQNPSNNTQGGTYNSGILTVLPSGDFYTGGTCRISTSDRNFTNYYNSSGVLQWKRRFAQTFDSGQSYFLTGVDNANNGAHQGPTNNYAGVLIAKVNSSASIATTIILDDSQRYEPFFEDTITTGGYPSIVFDKQNNIYELGIEYSENNGYGLQFRTTLYNSTGTRQWSRVLGLGGSFPTGASLYVSNGCLYVDSSNNVYLLGTLTTGNEGLYNEILIAKYNTSGVLQWQGSLKIGSPFPQYYLTFAKLVPPDRNCICVFDDIIYISLETFAPGSGTEDIYGNIEAFVRRGVLLRIPATGTALSNTARNFPNITDSVENNFMFKASTYNERATVNMAKNGTLPSLTVYNDITMTESTATKTESVQAAYSSSLTRFN